LPHRFTTFSCPLPLSSYKEKTGGKGVRLPENKENQKNRSLLSFFSLFTFPGVQQDENYRN